MSRIANTLRRLFRPPVLAPARVPSLDPLRKVYQQTGLWVPQPLRFAGYPCGCGLQCEHCSNVPDSWEIIIAGMAATVPEVCANCPDLDDTYIVSNLTQVNESYCAWIYTLDAPSTCDYAAVEAWLVSGGSLTVNLKDAGGWTHIWTKAFGAPLDCSDIDGTDIPFIIDWSTTECLGTGATCTATAQYD